jgi:hypothetical protein
LNDARGRFDGTAYLSTRHGPLLEPLRQADYFRRCFVFELSQPLSLAA